MPPAPTLITVLTPAGRGAVATVSVEGPQATELVQTRFASASGKPLSAVPLRRILYGRWTSGDGPGEEVVVCRLSPDRIEVHCHGGAAAVEAAVGSLEAAGGIRRSAEEWTYSHCRDPIQAEAGLALAEAKTERTASILLDQYHGALRREIEAILDLLERSLAAEASSRLAALSQRAAYGLHLTAPWRIAIIGPPNVGKSSLMNALVGYSRSIVFDQPGTTRDLVVADTAFDGWPVQLVDTAGLRETHNDIEAVGVDLANQAGRAADLRLVVRDVDCPAQLTHEDGSLTVCNKIDLDENRAAIGVGIRVSAKTGEGLDDLMQEIVRSLVGTPPTRGEAVPFSSRQAVLLIETAEQIAAGRIAEASASLETLLAGPSDLR